ncbi:hypothetical protein B0I37DRAFT_13567 [Chaetomium sp. MPI-CAGE-AT-0009]|nr:hypothetical protein B0I37DRAFT_13567 [Chaetomium sp. MPI-CAGE-AT-0009]
MDATAKKAVEQPKRRACDECRGRKLACSKEVDGCARCKREGIKCVYSAQKRMGRPRKHRAVEVAEPQPPPAVAKPTEPPTQEEVQSIMAPNFEFDSTLGMDLDLSFLDMNNMDMNFLEIVDPNVQFPPAPAQLDLDPVPVPTENGKPPEPRQHPGAFWPMSSNLSDINFDEPTGSSAPPPAPEITAEEVSQILSVELETLPSLSPPSSSTPSTHDSPPESDGAKSCDCLSAIYLALNSLQYLPKNVGEAMRVARTATKAAHDTILCPNCGDPPLEPTGAPPLQALQSLMMLGALLPSLSNAYMRILTMVDAEAAEADANRRKIMFTLTAYGGLWGWMAKSDPAKCGAADRLEGAMLEPILWRLTVRALLKMDVYGINDLTPGVEDDVTARQPGLKDIINMLEERSRRRHEQMDAMVAAGLVLKSNCQYVSLSSGDKPTCMRIIEIAKRSMDDLIIP